MTTRATKMATTPPSFITRPYFPASERLTASILNNMSDKENDDPTTEQELALDARSEQTVRADQFDQLINVLQISQSDRANIENRLTRLGCDRTATLKKLASTKAHLEAQVSRLEGRINELEEQADADQDAHLVMSSAVYVIGWGQLRADMLKTLKIKVRFRRARAR